MNSKIIYHIDVNSAFLSWESAYRLHVLGETVDLREIPSAIGGDQKSRHGIILAKSMPAKKYNIQTGEPLVNAFAKCPSLVVVPPHYAHYVECSRKFIQLLKRYAPIVEQYSIDEAYCDMTGTEKLYGSPVIFAQELKSIIYQELGFTVNIGVSNNKLLAKMAGELKKPNLVHTLFPKEMEKKLWPLPVEELFFVGRATKRKLYTLGITTIGALARTDKGILKSHLKSHGEVIWNFANGIDASPVIPIAPENKGYGNSITTAFDVTTLATAQHVLLSLCETVGARLRFDGMKASCISISITNNDFEHSSHQMKLSTSTDVTYELHHTACFLFNRQWDKTPVRQLGVHTSHLSKEDHYQYDFFNTFNYQRLSKLDTAIDSIRKRYGEDSVFRACFLNSQTNHMSGGLDKDKRTGITKGIV